jgi:riboflavin transporter FmnP
MTTAPAAATSHPHEYPTFGLPSGSVRGFLSVLICSFFWIVLLYPAESTIKAPLGHFFLLTLVFMAFASQPFLDAKAHLLPWLMKLLFIGGSAAVVAVAFVRDPALASARLTPSAADITQWPVLLGCFTGGFAVALFLRFVLGRRNELFLTIRAWVGVIAMLLLLVETILQFLVLPGMTDVSSDAMKIWEGVIIAAVAGYFGARA